MKMLGSWTGRAVVLALIVAGCATTPQPRPERPVREAERPVTKVELAPPEAAQRATLRDATEKRLAARVDYQRVLAGQTITLSARDSALRTALLSLVSGTPYSLNFGAGVPDAQKVTVEFKDVPLGDALEQLLTPLGLDFRVEGTTIVVERPRLETRIFSFDYPVAARKGSRQFSVAGFSSGNTTGGGGGGGGGNGTGGGGGRSGGTGSATVSSTTDTDVWREVGDTLYTVVFAKARAGAASSSATETGLNQTDATGRKLITNPTAGVVVVTASPAVLDEVGDLLAVVGEALTRQVLIEVRLLQVTLTDAFVFGIDLDYQPNLSSAVEGILTPFVTPSPTIKSPSRPAVGQRLTPQFSNDFLVGVTSRNFSVLLEALRQAGNVNILASPKISALNNQQAVISVVSDQVFFRVEPGETIIPPNGGQTITTPNVFVPEVFPVGVIVDVIPQISKDRNVSLQIHPSISNLTGTAEAPDGSTQPIIDRRELDTIITVRDGDTVVIGGLIDEAVENRERGVPLLMDIPLIGTLFKRIEKSTQKRELMMFITPKVLDRTTMAEMSRDAEQRLRPPTDKGRNP
jgi:MSHA biogenesis protein MshL